MTERELGNFSQWPLKELLEKERAYPKGHSTGDEMRAEIGRRVAVVDQQRAQSNLRYGRVSLIIAFVSLLVGVVYWLDRGIYLGSTSYVVQGILYKNCKYLFVTGISELPAHGGPLENVQGGRMFSGRQNANERDNLYCRLIAD